MAAWRDDEINTIRRERIKQVFDQALDLPVAQRLAFVSSSCRDDREIFAAVRDLLRDFDGAGTLLNSPFLKICTTEGAKEQPARFSIGDVIASRFVVTYLIGHGGMGEVYEVKDTELNVNLALKTIRSELAQDERYLRRLKQELRLARQITHPNVCRVFDFGRHSSESGDTSFFTMELLRGRTLREHVERNAPISLSAALPVIRQIADGLDAAHAAGIVHRDLKPGNVLLVNSGNEGLRAVITDFGLARASLPCEKLTSTGELAGTLAYMAPEQLHGESATSASDIYALGIIVLEMLTSRQSPPVGQNGLERAAPRSPEIKALSTRIETAIASSIARDPDKRYLTANQFINQLELCEAKEPTRARSQLGKALRVSGVLLASLIALMALFLAALRLLSRRAAVPVGSGILITEIANQTGDEELDAATDVLLHELRQSAHFDIIERAKVKMMLQQMGQPYRQQLDPAAAREVTWRSGGAMVVYGSISRVGPALNLALRLERLGKTPTGTPPSWSQSFQANDKKELFNAIEAGSRWIREMAGEKSSDFADERLPQDTTTSSWEALLLFSQAEKLKALDHTTEAIERLQKAVEIDPDFALAYMRLGDLSNYLENDQQGFEYWSKAIVAMQTRPLTRREELRIKGLYAADTGDHTSARDLFHQWETLYPRDYLPSFYLAGSLISNGRYDEAIQKLDEAQSKQPDAWYILARRARCNLARARYDEVSPYIAELRRIGQTETADVLDSALAFIRGDYKRSLEHLQPLATSADDSWKSIGFGLKASLMSELAEYDRAKEILSEGVGFDSKRGRVGPLADKHIALAYLAWHTKDYHGCKANSLSAIRSEAGQSHLALAGTLLARCGFLRDARAIERRLNGMPSGPIFESAKLRVEGELLLSGANPAAALREFESASKLDEADSPKEYLARAFVAVGYLREALQAYQHISDFPGQIWQEADLQFPGLWADSLAEYARLSRQLDGSDIALNRYTRIRKQSVVSEQRTKLSQSKPTQLPRGDRK